MSYLDCGEFEQSSKKLKDHIEIGNKMISKLATALVKDDEFFQLETRGEFKDTMVSNMEILLRLEKNLENHMESFRNTIFQVDALLSESQLCDANLPNPEELFAKQMEICKNAPGNEVSGDVRLKELGAMLSVRSQDESNRNGQDLDFEVEGEQEDRIPMDPFTQQEVDDPVKNKHCQHVYDKKGITDYINTARKARCPVIGCGNRNKLSFNDLIEDSELKAKIDRIKHRRAQS